MIETPWDPRWFDEDDLRIFNRNVFSEHYDAVVDAIESLTAAEREVVELLFWEGETVTGVAARLGISHQAVGDRYKRALGKLKEALGGLYEND